MLWDNSYRFSCMGIAMEEGGIGEELREEKLPLAIRLNSILHTRGWWSEQRGLSRGSDLFSSKLLDPPTHPLVSIGFQMQNNVRILIEIKNGKVFLRVDNNRILP